MTAYFNDARTEQILGHVIGDPTRPVVLLLGMDDAAQLLQAKRIQTCKILFHKLAKSSMSTFEKQVIPEMNKMNEDGTRILCYIIKTTMSTTATAAKNALSQLIELCFKD